MKTKEKEYRKYQIYMVVGAALSKVIIAVFAPIWFGGGRRVSRASVTAESL